MDNTEIITSISLLLFRESMKAKLLDELLRLEFEVDTMTYYRDVAVGQYQACIELLDFATGTKKESFRIYNHAVTTAQKSIAIADGDIIELLDFCGFDGKAYYKEAKKRIKKGN